MISGHHICRQKILAIALFHLSQCKHDRIRSPRQSQPSLGLENGSDQERVREEDHYDRQGDPICS